MPKAMTLDQLKAMSIHDRANLYKNASTLAHTAEGAALKKLIEQAGLPFSEDACLTDEDPITIKMHQVIFSEAGKAAALSATADGLPAMAGIDPLLQSVLGSDYGTHNVGTATAGSIVAQLMQSLGYKKNGSKTMPANCVAKTAATWS